MGQIDTSGGVSGGNGRSTFLEARFECCLARRSAMNRVIEGDLLGFFGCHADVVLHLCLELWLMVFPGP